MAAMLGLPARDDASMTGTTVMVVAPAVTIQGTDESDATMQFIAEAVAWNFWPRMIDTPGGTRHSMEFRVVDNGVRVRIPDPRTHPRLRGFVEAMDLMRHEPSGEDELTLDREIRCLRPGKTLGRLTIQKGPMAPADLPERPVPQGAHLTAGSVHHIALMRTPELVVKYLAGAAPAVGRMGYCGVFKCALDVDEVFKAAEPPTHDDWVYRFVSDRHWRTYVKVALDRIQRECRNAAGYEPSITALDQSDGIPLGEFADALAALMPGHEGPGARRPQTPRTDKPTRRRRSPGSRDIDEATSDTWIDGTISASAETNFRQTVVDQSEDGVAIPKLTSRPPQVKQGGDPTPAIAADGVPVVRYPFELRGRGNRLRLSATVEILTNDGNQVEIDPPAGYVAPDVHSWLDPSGYRHSKPKIVVGPEGVDGIWAVEVELREEMMQVDIVVEGV
ncbi:hypothetical protein C1Y40_04693 [Mycobacterium talmoniae]|uniref:Uncharacterized protein n=1 Tax=Mycobacterium talmoniae TaxID=1858794 RepID=A0A2S8BES3_9MYCO|nr:hypothetical protein C1Y40_04693 [Mycobacterium talmoniae]